MKCKCGRQLRGDRRLCRECQLAERDGTDDHVDRDPVDVECCECGTLFCSEETRCPECGSTRRRYAGPLEGENDAIADGGTHAYLGPDQHFCDLCGREFERIDELANHACPDIPLVADDTGTARVVHGPDPEALDEECGWG